MNRVPLFLLLAIMPLGVAGHNIGTGVIAVMLLALLWLRRRVLPLTALWTEHRVALLAAVGFMLAQIAGTMLNPANPAQFSVSYIFGHFIWAFLPAVVVLGQTPLTPRDWQRLLVALAGVMLFMALMSVSQGIWGWKLLKTQVVYGYPRAQGLYSHPMSFGYLCLLLVPLSCLLVTRWPRRPMPWLLAFSVLTAIIASRSRMVELVTAATIVFNIVVGLRGRARALLLAGAVATIAVLLSTDNFVGQRFWATLQGIDVHGDFPDDRVAFWRVNADMVAQRPIFGHGEGLTTAYRLPYYAAAGLADFPRKYEAHNMFLQVAVNAGACGLAMFLVWLIDLWTKARRAQAAGLFAGQVLVQTIAVFCLGGLTQNAFQDAVVRFALTLLVTGLWLAIATKPAAVDDIPRGLHI